MPRRLPRPLAEKNLLKRVPELQLSPSSGTIPGHPWTSLLTYPEKIRQ